MHPLRRVTFACFALVVFIALSGQAFSSAAVAVGNCTKLVNYPTIQLAVNAAPAGGTVKVCPGVYPEQVTINKNLTLIGTGPTASTVVVPAGGLVTNGVTDIYNHPTAAQIFVQNATAVTISHMTIDGANDGLTGCGVDAIGIYYQNAAGTITDNAVRNVLLPPGLQGCQDGLAINVEASTGNPVVKITNNSVRNYDKNGITVSGPGGLTAGPKATISGNTIIGLGPTSVIAQNGIQISYGATAVVQYNYVADDIYTGPLYGSSGILIYASQFVAVANNTVESTQLGIVPASYPPDPPANHTTIQMNQIGGTQTYDAIDVCSDDNTVLNNVIYGSSQDAIHLDDECRDGVSGATGSGNYVESNTINEACAGVLEGPLSTSNTVPLTGNGANTFLNVDNLVLANSNTCTPLLAPDAGTKGRARHLRPSPLKPHRN